MRRHPVVTVATAAIVARTVMAAALNVTDTWSLAPDAGQYLAIAEAAADGRIQTFWLGYGESLYQSTWTYSAPLALLFEVFGPYRAFGQGISVACGVFTAAVTTMIALRLVKRPYVLGAGLILAFLALLVAAVMVSGAVTDGNLGTAFRHRGQVLWALAILAVAALQHIRDRSVLGPVNGKSGTP